jgi:glycosyltransferase involved in cell wall biosynthesis
MINLNFFPDFAHSNKYQQMLYSESYNNGFKVNKINNPFEVPLDTDILHFHWQHTIWDFVDNKEEFVKTGFSKLFEYKKNKEKNIKTIWTVHNAIPHQSKRFELDIALMQKISDKSDIIHLLSENSLNEIEKHIKINHEKIMIVPHSNYDKFFKIEKTETFKDKVVIGAVTKINTYKNFDLLLQAYLELKNIYNNLVLIVAGLGEDKQTINKIKAESKNDNNIIVIDEFLSDEQFNRISNFIDIAVYPYSNILNSGSTHCSFTFEHHVVVPKFNSLEHLNNLKFISFFEPNSLQDLIKTLKFVIENKEYAKYKNDLKKWNNENTSTIMSNRFFNEVGKLL